MPFQITPKFTFITDSTESILEVSRPLAAWLGRSPEECVGLDLEKILIKNSSVNSRFPLTGAKGSGVAVGWLLCQHGREEVYVRRWLGDRLDEHITYVEPVATAGVSADESALSTVRVHDIKNPLNIAVGYLSILSDEYSDDMPGESVQLLKKIDGALERLNQVVNSIQRDEANPSVAGSTEQKYGEQPSSSLKSSKD